MLQLVLKIVHNLVTTQENKRLLTCCKSALMELKDYPLQGGYSMELLSLFATLERSEALDDPRPALRRWNV